MGVGRNFPEDRISDVYFAVVNDNPTLFYVGMHMCYQISDDVYIEPQYRFNMADAQTRLKAMIKIADRLWDGASHNIIKDEFMVNDYILNNVKYYNFEECDNQYMDSALIDGISVCKGISEAVSFLLNYIGIPCGVIRGKLNGGSHAWNIVEINGVRYHLDVTNNKTSDGGIYYWYFNMSDDQIRRTHSFDYKTGCYDGTMMHTGRGH